MPNSLSGFCFCTLATTLGYSVELSEPQLAHLSNGDNICPANLKGWLCPVGTCPSFAQSLFFAVCMPSSLIEDELLGNKDAMETSL